MLSFSFPVRAMTVTYYGYDTIYDSLPTKNKSAEYIYKVDNIPKISFAKYNSDDYKTSIKKISGKNDLLYCANFSKHITFNKTFAAKNNLFNNELRTRIGIALYLGTTKWNQLANPTYTNNNAILDYYMTQLVIHSLIYKFGGANANYGVDFNAITFKEKTGTLKKNTTALYNFCCKEKIIYANGNFQDVTFSFNQPTNPYLYIQGDNLVSSAISCNSKSTNAKVSAFYNMIETSGKILKLSPSDISLTRQNDTYNSNFTVSIPIAKADVLKPGINSFSVSETVDFARQIAGFWYCTDKDYTATNQETSGLIVNTKSVSDAVTFNVLTGNVSLLKKDSVTGEIITDATFALLQYDDTIGDYIPYKTLTYNASTQKYESGNIFANITNSNSKFKLIEAAAGAQYINDWEGVTFELTKDSYIFEYSIENEPVLGSLHLFKEGTLSLDNETINNSSQNVSSDKTYPLANIKFGLYADEDIYLKGNIFYSKDQKIADIYTDTNGKATVEQLLAGKYYIKELETDSKYITDLKEHHFEITRDNNRKYNEISYHLINELKECELKIYKYYYESDNKENKKKSPLSDVTFGLYAKNDILDIRGQCIIAKDELIAEKKTDKDGLITFSNLYYADYYIKELSTQKDFVLNDGILEVNAKEFVQKENGSSTSSTDNNKPIFAAYKEILNQKQLFTFKITKSGQYIDHVEQVESENGTYFTYHLGNKNLEHVTYDLYDESMNLIGSKITNKNGNVFFSNLEPGKYYYLENDCPDEYIKDTSKKEINCEVSSTLPAITFHELNDLGEDCNNENNQLLVEEECYNELCSVTLNLSKKGEIAEATKNGLQYNYKPLNNIVFGLYQSFDYAISESITQPKDSCVGYLVTSTAGIATYSGILPTGKYYIKELKTNKNYEINNEPYFFDITPQHKNVSIDLNNGEPFINNLSKAAVQINKTDSNTGKVLKNVEFTLYNSKDEKLGVYKTDKEGKIFIDNLPYGNYYFVETKCKNGYYSTNNKYNFTLNSSETITLNITNSPILKLGFEEHYKLTLIIISVILCGTGVYVLFLHKRKDDNTL